MYTEEVWIGSNIIGLFIWSQKCVLVNFGCMGTWLDEMDGSTIVPHGQDGLEAQSLFAGTLACILKRSGLVPTALVFSFGVRNVFWSILVAWAHGWMKWMALL
jgi:hypothetical protein